MIGEGREGGGGGGAPSSARVSASSRNSSMYMTECVYDGMPPMTERRKTQPKNKRTAQQTARNPADHCASWYLANYSPALSLPPHTRQIKSPKTCHTKNIDSHNSFSFLAALHAPALSNLHGINNSGGTPVPYPLQFETPCPALPANSNNKKVGDLNPLPSPPPRPRSLRHCCPQGATRASVLGETRTQRSSSGPPGYIGRTDGGRSKETGGA